MVWACAMVVWEFPSLNKENIFRMKSQDGHVCEWVCFYSFRILHGDLKASQLFVSMVLSTVCLLLEKIP